MNDSTKSKKLIKRNGPVLKWTVPAAMATIASVVCTFVFWPFAILFALVALATFGLALLSVEAKEELSS